MHLKRPKSKLIFFGEDRMSGSSNAYEAFDRTIDEINQRIVLIQGEPMQLQLESYA